MRVDESGRDRQPGAIHGFVRLHAVQSADRCDTLAVNQHVPLETRLARAVDDKTVFE